MFPMTKNSKNHARNTYFFRLAKFCEKLLFSNRRHVTLQRSLMPSVFIHAIPCATLLLRDIGTKMQAYQMPYTSSESIFYKPTNKTHRTLQSITQDLILLNLYPWAVTAPLIYRTRPHISRVCSGKTYSKERYLHLVASQPRRLGKPGKSTLLTI